MPTQTPNYNLTKPLKTENYNVDVFNNNVDIIDSALKDINDKTNKNNTSFTGTMKLNNNNVITDEVKQKLYATSDLLNGWRNTVEDDWAKLLITKIGAVNQLRVYGATGGSLDSEICVLPDFCNSSWVNDSGNSGIFIEERKVFIKKTTTFPLIFTWIA